MYFPPCLLNEFRRDLFPPEWQYDSLLSVFGCFVTGLRLSRAPSFPQHILCCCYCAVVLNTHTTSRKQNIEMYARVRRTKYFLFYPNIMQRSPLIESVRSLYCVFNVVCNDLLETWFNRISIHAFDGFLFSHANSSAPARQRLHRNWMKLYW